MKEIKFSCKCCGKNLPDLEAIYLHERIGNLCPNHYYCEECVERKGKV